MWGRDWWRGYAGLTPWTCSPCFSPRNVGNGLYVARWQTENPLIRIEKALHGKLQFSALVDGILLFGSLSSATSPVLKICGAALNIVEINCTIQMLATRKSG